MFGRESTINLIANGLFKEVMAIPLRLATPLLAFRKNNRYKTGLQKWIGNENRRPIDSRSTGAVLAALCLLNWLASDVRQFYLLH